jgi:hypothetical protein
MRFHPACLLASALLLTFTPLSLPAQAHNTATFQLAAAGGSRLTAAQIRKLRRSGIPLIVPGYVPPGYFVSQVKVASDRMMPGLSYTLTYKKSSGEAFTVVGNDGGFGGPEPDMEMSVPNPVIGSISLDRYGPNDQDNSNYVSEIHYGKLYYSFSSSGGNGVRRVSGPDAIKILKGLRLI